MQPDGWRFPTSDVRWNFTRVSWARHNLAVALTKQARHRRRQTRLDDAIAASSRGAASDAVVGPTHEDLGLVLFALAHR